MAKTTPTATTPTEAPTEALPVPEARELRLGDLVTVLAPEGHEHLRNAETGGFFEPGVPTPQTVTTTLLRRLTDGDLVVA